MKFRNYLPHDKQLQEGKLAPVALPKFEDPVVVAPIEPQKAEVCTSLHMTNSVMLLGAFLSLFFLGQEGGVLVLVLN